MDRESATDLLQLGAACSIESPAAMDSQACCRQRKLKCPDGASQSGKTVNVFPHGITDSAPCPYAFVPIVVGEAEPASMTDDRVVPAKRTLPRQEVQWDHPRVDVVIYLWQCDKENHGWREGQPLTVPAKFRSEDRPSPSR